MKKRLLAFSLLLAALLLSGCSGQPGPVGTPQPQPAAFATQPPALLPATEVTLPALELPEGYDPSSEEDEGGRIGSVLPAGQSVSRFAGATPIPLDPIDLPSPTPRPPLAFTYAEYTANKLGIRFESVAGYTEDASEADSYILTQPEDAVRDNYAVRIAFTITPVTSTYKAGDIPSDLRSKVDALGAYNYIEWRKYSVEKRTLMQKDGYYTTYRGVLYDGTVVRGTVHMALLDQGRLLTLHLSCPGQYNSDYTGVYAHIRNSLKPL